MNNDTILIIKTNSTRVLCMFCVLPQIEMMILSPHPRHHVMSRTLVLSRTANFSPCPRPGRWRVHGGEAAAVSSHRVYFQYSSSRPHQWHHHQPPPARPPLVNTRDPHFWHRYFQKTSTPPSFGVQYWSTILWDGRFFLMPAGGKLFKIVNH